ncbi:hypothetical protein SCE1572_13730 [Sorangium cellulosum So0157-2]|uniref:Uncharacterized protein n=1 Tax=Sorangium cellulosum So0157-2 TaxID=1254432 RepID=S4XT16_SORCE|nr:hypothetical protein SCE1572_13730 [Sorangium cellulosum So0157-2]
MACFQSASSYRRAGSGRITGLSMVSNAVRRQLTDRLVHDPGCLLIAEGDGTA